MILEITSDMFKKKFLATPESLELIDVREFHEYTEMHIKWSKLIPMGELERRLGEIDWTKEVIFICRSGGRSGYVTQALNNAGYAGKSLSGGVHMLQFNCKECMEVVGK